MSLNILALPMLLVLAVVAVNPVNKGVFYRWLESFTLEVWKFRFDGAEESVDCGSTAKVEEGAWA